MNHSLRGNCSVLFILTVSAMYKGIKAKSRR